MPNHFIFDQSNSNFFGKLVNTYAAPGVVAPPDNDATVNAREFATTFTTSSSLGILGGSVIASMQLTNPSGSGRSLYVSNMAGGVGVGLSLLSSFSGSLVVARGGTIASPSTLTPVNTLFGSAAASVMTARSSTSVISAGTNFLSFPLDPGMFSLGFGGGIIVPPNQSLSMTVSGALSVAGTLSCFINLTWWEA
ncbi:hypothetical protein [Paenibacillus sacheonensis]|uniref:Uncharacterized protein n=1 Tax=Paenibacillus sacheonensis TaxID=742054 RepID=A0A7X5C0A8_9BACL|nr:hypothetical protein [Paenibacillus sacheonensis]MBM7566615.1 hypothetical protein [Paenibacillus sacheonensis]NBC73533.1 hypothetical protein [Paenibacillus sacheonensis]